MLVSKISDEILALNTATAIVLPNPDDVDPNYSADGVMYIFGGSLSTEPSFVLNLNFPTNDEYLGYQFNSAGANIFTGPFLGVPSGFGIGYFQQGRFWYGGGDITNLSLGGTVEAWTYNSVDGFTNNIAVPIGTEVGDNSYSGVAVISGTLSIGMGLVSLGPVDPTRNYVIDYNDFSSYQAWQNDYAVNPGGLGNVNFVDVTNRILSVDGVNDDIWFVDWNPTTIGDPWDYTAEAVTFDVPLIGQLIVRNLLSGMSAMIAEDFLYIPITVDTAGDTINPAQIIKLAKDMSGYTVITIIAGDAQAQSILDDNYSDNFPLAFGYSETDDLIFMSGGPFASPPYYATLGAAGGPQSNYQIKDAIRLGCWSPCINVGYKD